MMALRDAVVGWCALLAAAAPALAEPTGPATTRCEYLRVFAEPDSAVVHGHQTDALEPLRRLALARATDAARSLGLEVVDDRESAWLRLQVSAFASDFGDPYLRLDLTPYLKLQHHHFVALLGDPDFPSGGKLGASYGMELNPVPAEAELARRIHEAIRWVWNRSRPEIDALCALRARLVDEGWAEIEELRKRLVIEMERVRERRRRDAQQKRLELDVESGAR